MERMLKKVAVSDGCHIWTGCKTPDGYPRVGRKGNPNIRAHRYFYEQLHGKIPEGQVVRHTCDNPLCLNPEHLILGTPDENVQDRSERARTHNHVSFEQVEEVKRLRALGLSQLKTANLVGCSQMFISKLERGLFKRYQNVG